MSNRLILKPKSQACLAAVALTISLPACARRDAGHAADQAHAHTARTPAAATATPQPMAPFERLIDGRWQLTLDSGQVQYQAWAWGPGRYSLRKTATGLADVRDSWAGEVMYWHPGKKKVCILSLHGEIPGVGRGAGEGWITFDGETAEARIDLVQPRGTRKLATRWTFSGPDRYRDELLEAAGSGFQQPTGSGFRPLAAWDFVRVPVDPHSRLPEAKNDPAEAPPWLIGFNSLFDGAWTVNAEAADGPAHPHTAASRITFDWIGSLDVVHARVLASRPEAQPESLLDVYVYQEVRGTELRCLALSDGGGVYQGTLTAGHAPGDTAARTLEITLRGFEGDRERPYTARLELDRDGQLRTQISTTDAGRRSLVLDAIATKRSP